jgi:isoquinoline 1-oxidoreductase subunit beta
VGHKTLASPSTATHCGAYEVLRFDAMPKVEVHIVPSTEKPTGVGEPGVLPIGPAVANALYQVNKKRRRMLPFNRPENA